MFHDRMCFLLETREEAEMLGGLLSDAGYKWVLNQDPRTTVYWSDGGVWYCLTGENTIWYHNCADQRHRKDIEVRVHTGQLEKPVRFADLMLCGTPHDLSIDELL